MTRRLLAIVVLVLFSAPTVLAARDPDRKNFSSKDLNHGYVFRVRGFNQNEPSAPFHSGEVAALGLIHFDGAGKIIDGNINFTVADNGGGSAAGDQFQCVAPIDATKSLYTIASNGTGTLTIVLTTTQSGATCDGTTSGTYVFNFILDSDDTKNASLLLKSFSSAVIAGETIDTMVLDGAMAKRHQ